jgi:hypothetical protein
MLKPRIIIFGVALALFGLVSIRAAELLDPLLLLKEIESKGPDFVYKNILIKEKWLAFVKNVESGKKPWLQVAAAIHPATDGGPSEALTLAAGVALIHSPKEVLLVAGPELGIEGVCGFPDMGNPQYDTQKKTVSYLDARIKTVSKLSQPEIGQVRDQCLKFLEKTKSEVLSPKGPFSSYSGSNTTLNLTRGTSAPLAG